MPHKSLELGLHFGTKHHKMEADSQLERGWNMITATMAEAKTNLSKLAARANETGESITVLKNSKPWIEICPLAYGTAGSNAAAASDAAQEQDFSAYYHPVSDPLPPETLEAIKEVDEMMAHPERYKPYSNPDALFEHLGI